MIDVDTVIDGTFEPRNASQAVEAAIVVQQKQIEVNQGKVVVFSFFLVIARNHMAAWKQRADKGELNDPDAVWYSIAATAFEHEMAAAIASWEARDITKKELSTAVQAVRVLRNAMDNGAPLLDRDAGGEFTLAGKTKIEQWSAKKAQEERDKQNAINAEIAKQAAGESIAPVDGAETGVEFAGFPEVQAQFDLIVGEVHSILNQEQDAEYKDRKGHTHTNTPEETAVLLLRGIVGRLRNDIQQRFQAVLDDAANDEGSTDKEAATG